MNACELRSRARSGVTLESHLSCGFSRWKRASTKMTDQNDKKRKARPRSWGSYPCLPPDHPIYSQGWTIGSAPGRRRPAASSPSDESEGEPRPRSGREEPRTDQGAPGSEDVNE